MGNRQGRVSSIEFVNESEIARIEVIVGNEKKTLNPKGIAKFEILNACQSTVRGFDKTGRLIHEAKFGISHMGSSQVWKVTNSGVKHKKSPFFTETYPWTNK